MTDDYAKRNTVRTHPLIMAITEQRIPPVAVYAVTAFVAAIVIGGIVLVGRRRR
ncbi:MAG: hypothetical protein JF597_44125 [Streptomyces sp.]|uniref:hypothetical protein n=1 Tax=Streptomyces sp. TaxID=1931 RepID=UPI0025DF2BC8|nr:hypothetical protein [Streptomyces sp.]MBW8800314.1 hypothetical protein [Streptomyces sp.]